MASGSNLHCLQWNVFFANCQTCKQKPGSESQAVLSLTYALPAAIKKKKKKKLEVKFGPKLHLCNLRDLEGFLLITAVLSPSSQQNCTERTGRGI